MGKGLVESMQEGNRIFFFETSIIIMKPVIVPITEWHVGVTNPIRCSKSLDEFLQPWFYLWINEMKIVHPIQKFFLDFK